MYMNSAPHLLTEDRPEFERVLDRALRDPALRSASGAPAGHPHRLTTAQLRAMALNASSAISACAAAEYDRYRELRERDRADRSAPDGGVRRTAPTGTSGTGGATGTGGAFSGAGIFPVITVLTPILAGAAALIFLLTGYLLAAVRPEPAIASPLRTAGWLFLAIAGAGVLVCIVGMLLTALRDGHGAIRAAQPPPPDALAAARADWSAALLERGMLPFLREALDSGGEQAAPRRPRPERGGPRAASTLGYSRPGFSSPGGDPAPSRGPRFSPDFSSPDFSSPDFSSAEHEDGGAHGRRTDPI